MLSTVEVPYKYEVVTLVYAYGNSSSFFQGLSLEAAYGRCAEMLGTNTLKAGGDAVIGIRFDYRVALGGTIPFLNITERVFEIFGYGTAVRTLEDIS
jgi:hypothetical protein